MPIYNGIEFIEESMSSILNQTYTNYEVLIAINGHPPKSEVYDIAKKYESDKVTIFDFYQFSNKSDTLNEMLKYCKYDYVALLDVDDIWMNDKLEKQVKYIHDYDVVASHCVYFGESAPAHHPNLPMGDISKFNFIKVNPIINSSSITKKELCRWNKKYDGIEDYELWLKLWKDKCKFYNYPEYLVKHRIHKSSAFNTKNFSNLLNEIRLMYK
jgi:glycosyltransferase involved in cell wall biosynthesis